MEFINVPFVRIWKPLPEARGRFFPREWLKFVPYRLNWRIKTILAVRPAKKYQMHVVWHFLANEIADERSRFAYLFRCHLCVVGGVHHDAEQCCRVSKLHKRSGLVYPMDECSKVGWSVGVWGRNEQMTQALRRKLVCNLHERVFMPVAIAGCGSIKAIAVTVI